MWKQVVPESTRHFYNDKLQEIVEFTDSYYSRLQEPGLMHGKLSSILFYYYYSRLNNNRYYQKKANEKLLEMVQYFTDNSSHSLLTTGITGLGWLLQHLGKNDFIEIDINYFLSNLDIFLENALSEFFESKNYDLFIGFIGIGLYFINRIENDVSKKVIIDKMLANLDKTSIYDKKSGGLKWEAVIKYNNEDDLGLAHGQSSILAFLIKASAFEINKNLVNKLIYGSSKFLSAKTEYIYNNEFQVTNENKKFRNKATWCHGELGIGATLYRSSTINRDALFISRAMDILEECSKVKDSAKEGIISACLCHGTSGNGLVFQRMYNYTNLDLYREASLFWVKETLKIAKKSDGYAGFFTNSHTEEDELSNNFGLMNGITGIGLALISAISDIEPSWDECLLIS